MIKLCPNPVAHRLTLIFQNFDIPIHQINDKQVVSNYRPVSLLPISSKIFEKLNFNKLFKIFRTKIFYLNINRVFTRVIHVFIKYLQSLMTSFSNFDCNPTLEARGVFLDLCKAFDRVLHDGLLFKSKQNGVGANIFQFITSFLSVRFQRAILNGQTSDCQTIRASAPQCLSLGPLFSLIYIDILAKNLKSNVKL